MKIKALLVDDHTLFRTGMRAALTSYQNKIDVINEAASGTELFAIIPNHIPDILLLDIVLPDISGIEIAKKIKTDYPQIKILILSAENSCEIISDVLAIGVNGFISKSAVISELTEAIFSIMEGVDYFGTDISRIIYDVYISKTSELAASREVLTEREKEIIAYCSNALSGKEIADKLKISLRTVDAHKTNIFKKLGINSTVELVKYAIKHGIIQL